MTTTFSQFWLLFTETIDLSVRKTLVLTGPLPFSKNVKIWSKDKSIVFDVGRSYTTLIFIIIKTKKLTYDSRWLILLEDFRELGVHKHLLSKGEGWQSEEMKYYHDKKEDLTCVFGVYIKDNHVFRWLLEYSFYPV